MVWRSPYPDVSIPDLSLHEMVLQQAAAQGDKPALVEAATGRTITYRQLLHDVDRCAGGLAERGIRQGDVVAIFCPNLPEYATVLYGVSKLGAITTSVNYLYTAGELQTQLMQTRAVLLITTPDLVDRAREAAGGTAVREIITIGEAEGTVPFAEILASTGEVPRVAIEPARDVTVLPCSSGTTGLNKAVMLSHRNIVANLAQCEPYDFINPDDVLLGVLPFYHIYGMVVILHGALFRGATVAIMPRFDFVGMLDAIERHRISLAHLVPPIILALVKHPLVEDRDLSSLKQVNSGAAPLDGVTAEACVARIGCTVSQGYGLTETSPVTHYSPTGEPPGYSGRPIPNTECRIVDPASGADLGPNEPGEVWVRGPQVMLGYLDNPEATAWTIDAEGWLHTGDLGMCDESGNIIIVDRIKELIKYKGFQIAPAELEGILLTHPMVADCAVIRVPDEESGEVPKAFVVLKGEVASEDLLGFVAERVAPYKKIRRLEVVDAVPRSSSGKILRRVLIEREREKAATR